MIVNFRGFPQHLNFTQYRGTAVQTNTKITRSFSVIFTYLGNSYKHACIAYRSYHVVLPQLQHMLITSFVRLFQIPRSAPVNSLHPNLIAPPKLLYGLVDNLPCPKGVAFALEIWAGLRCPTTDASSSTLASTNLEQPWSTFTSELTLR